MNVPVVVARGDGGLHTDLTICEPGAAGLPQTWTVFLELANFLELLEALRNRRAQGRERLLRHLGGKLGETLVPKLSAPFALDVAKDVVHFCEGSASPLGKADDARAARVGCIGPFDIAETFEAAEELVQGLLAHAGTL